MKRSLKKGIAILALAAPVLAGCNGTEKPHEHTFVKHDAIAATCAENGNILYYTCEGCEEFFDSEHNTITESETILAATGIHSYTTLSVKTMPTKQSYTALESFESTGLKLEKECEVCHGKVEVTATPTFDKTVLHGNDSKVTATVDGLSVDIPVTVSKVQVTKPTADATEFTYTGEEQTYTIAASELYEVTGNKRTEAGSQQVTVALKNKTDYCWSDGSTADLSFTFAIGKKAVTISGFSDSYAVKCHETPSFGTIVADNSATVTTKVYSGETEVTDLTKLTEGSYTVKFSVAETANYAAAEVSKTLTVTHDFACEVKDSKYLKSAATCQAYAVYYKSCVCGEASTTATFDGTEKAAHNWVWDKTTSADEDTATCDTSGCLETLTFSKVPTATGVQELLMTEETLSADIATSTAYDSVKSIKLGALDLGTDPTNLDVTALKADPSKHGLGQKLTVTVEALGTDHTYEVPVDVITKKIASEQDFLTIQPASGNTNGTNWDQRESKNKDAVLGTYVQTADFSVNPDNCKSEKFDWNRTFSGTYDGAGHTISLTADAHSGGGGICGLFIHAVSAEIKNLTVYNALYKGWHQTCLIAKGMNHSTIDNCEIIEDGYGSAPQDDDSCGIFAWNVFQNNTVKNTKVYAMGIDLGTVFCFATNVNNNTFTNNTIICKSYLRICYSKYKNEEQGIVEGNHIEAYSTEIAWSSTDLDAIKEASKARYTANPDVNYEDAKFTTYDANSGYRKDLKRGAFKYAWREYLDVIFPKVNFNSYDKVMFRVASDNGFRTLYFPNSAADIYFQTATKEYGNAGSSPVGYSDFTITGGKVYQDGELVATIYDADILSGTKSLEVVMKGSTSGGQAGYNNYFSNLFCYTAPVSE